jgi:guanylate kinase
LSRGHLLVLSGPSGVGKDSVLREIFRRDPSISYSVSYTTRPPRPGEQDGVDYSFVSDEAFDDLEERGEMLEWARVHNHRYGTSRQRVEQALETGHDIALNIDVQGGMALRERVPDAFLVFLAPPSLEELTRRRLARGTEDAADLARREADARIEMGYADRYDAVVVNEDVGRTAVEVLRLLDNRRRAG